MTDYYMLMTLFLISLAAGFVLFLAVVKSVPMLEKRENLKQKKEVLKEADRQKVEILRERRQQEDENIALLEEEFEAQAVQSTENITNLESEMEARESLIEADISRVEKAEKKISDLEEKSRELDQEIYRKKTELIEQHESLVQGLAEQTKSDLKSLVEQNKAQILEERKLESQKVLRFLNDEMESQARKVGQRIMERVHARYSPEFFWPKSSNVVELSDPKILDRIHPEKSKLLESLAELSGVHISIVGLDEKERSHQPFIKVAGGYGIYREAARLALEDTLKLDANRDLERSGKDFYKRRVTKLEDEAVVLGKKAVTELGLLDIHPEIQKLVGALNWRTSYRQNQWYHTVEVAFLAGLIASEVGVDPRDAKRVGLLHDIGKAIDYRIEGSHAVISGDYADRFGEKRYICDTVMSHHADLIVESPLAYVLRAADTLSGARPGARVNLEEGYQIRLDGILESIHSFQGIADVAIMNGGREVHIQVDNNKVREKDIPDLTRAIAKKIESNVSFPGQIKVLVSRTFESVTVA